MLGYALGCIGLRYDDFCRLSAEEFRAVCKSYSEKEESHLHGEWERMRLLATITIQPHVKGKVTAHRLLPLPWDKNPFSEVSAVSKEESKARFESLVCRLKS